jgi:hypothetical protein
METPWTGRLRFDSTDSHFSGLCKDDYPLHWFRDPLPSSDLG